MKSAQRVWLTPAFLLHRYAYRDSSSIAEMFTRDYGRVALFARGARTPKSALRAALRPFQPLLVSWAGRSEAVQLTAAELDGDIARLPAPRLMSGFYLNELLLKLTERWDPHPELFASYAGAVAQLAAGGVEAVPLRRFEKRLLEELGYGLDLGRTDEGEPVVAELYYRVRAQRAVSRCDRGVPEAVSGRSLIELDQESFESADTARDAKRILRAAIEGCLEGRPLGSREVMMAMHRKERG